MATVEFLTPAALYAGNAGRVVEVDPTEMGVEFGQKLRPNDSPQFETLSLIGELNVACNAFLNANLTVANEATFNGTIDACGTLNVNNKFITIGNVDLPTDLAADGGGLVLLSDDPTGNKTILWLNAPKAWTFDQNVAILNGLSVGALTAPAADASIDLKAADKALLLNRLTTVQRDALTPVESMTIYNATTDQVEFYNGVSWQALGGGDVSGPASSVDNAIARFNGVGGENIQNSSAILTDAGVLSGLTQLQVDNLNLDGNVLSSTNLNGNIAIIPNADGDVVIGQATPTAGQSPLTIRARASDPTTRIGLSSPNGAGLFTIGIHNALNQAFLFQNSNAEMVFGTNSTKRMSIFADGDVDVINNFSVGGTADIGNVNISGNIISAISGNITLSSSFIGIKTSIPTNPLTVVTEGGASRGIANKLFKDDSQGSLISFEKARGTEASPVAILTDDIMMDFLSRGYDGVSFLDGASIVTQATENWSAGNHGTKIVFSVVPNGGTVLDTALTIENNKDINILASMKVQAGTNANKYDPVLLSSTAMPVSAGLPRFGLVNGNHFFVVEQNTGVLLIYDVTDPITPVLVVNFDLPGGAFPRALDVVGNFAYIADDTDDQLHIINIENKSSPTLVSSLSLNGAGALRGLKLSGPTAFVVGQAPALVSVDVTDPSNPVQLDTLTTADNGRVTFDIVGKFLYLPNSGAAGNIQIIDIEDPSNMSVVGNFSIGSLAWAVKKEGSLLYCVGDNNKLQILNVEDPTTPVSVGSITTLADPRTIEVNNGVCYITDTTVGTLKILDATDPSNIVEISNPLTIGSNPIATSMAGGLMYILDNGSDDFKIIDTSVTNIQNLKAGSSIISDLQVSNSLIVSKRINTSALGVGVGGIKVDGVIGVGTEGINSAGDFNMNLHSIFKLADPISATNALNRQTGLGNLVEPIKTTTFNIPTTFASNTLYKLVDTYTDVIEHVIPASSNSAFESTSIDVSTYSWAGAANDLLLDGTAGILSFAQDRTIIISANGGQYMNILGSGSGFFVIKGGSEVDFFDKVGVIKDHSFNVRGAGFIGDKDGITMINCRSNWTSFGYIALADEGQTMMDIALNSDPVSIRGGDISLFAGDTAFLIHNGAPASARLIIETNNFGSFIGTAFGSNTTGVVAMAATSPVGGTLVTPATGSRVWDGDTLIGANFTTDTQYNIGDITVSSTVLNEDGTAASYEIDILFDGTADLTGDFTMVGLDQTDPRILCVNNSGVFPVSRTIAFGEMNANTNMTAITDSTYISVDVTGLISNSITERFTLTNAATGQWTYDGLTPFNGKLSGIVSATKTGNTENYRFAVSINGAVPVFASALYSPMEVKTTKVSITVLQPINIVNGDTVQIMVAGDGTPDDITITDFVMNITT